MTATFICRRPLRHFAKPTFTRASRPSQAAPPFLHPLTCSRAGVLVRATGFNGPASRLHAVPLGPQMLRAAQPLGRLEHVLVDRVDVEDPDRPRAPRCLDPD